MTVEPCCCDRQLPPILEGPAHLGGTSFFTTNGDVSAKRMIESVAYLVPNAHLLLVTKREDVFLARFLRGWIDRHFLADIGWIAPFAVNSESKKELKALNEACCAKYDVDSECLILWNEHGDALVLNGPLPESTPASPHLCCYSAYTVRSTFNDTVRRRRLQQATETILPILRLHGSNKKCTILKARP